MTKAHIQYSLITRYALAIEKVLIAQSFKEIKSILTELHVFHGVCWCAHMLLNVSIIKQNWMIRHIKDYMAWGPFPRDAKTKEEVLQALELRLGILRYEYELSSKGS